MRLISFCEVLGLTKKVVLASYREPIGVLKRHVLTKNQKRLHFVKESGAVVLINCL